MQAVKKSKRRGGHHHSVRSKVKPDSLLGQGTYGYVHRVTMDGESRALKYFVCRKNEHFLNNLQELDIMCRVQNCPNLVNLFHISLDDPQEYVADKVFNNNPIGPLSIIMRCYDYDMFSYVQDSWHPLHLCDISYKITRGLCHLHSIGIIHRDIKPTNILMTGQEPYIGDFGLARTYNGVDRLSCNVSHVNYRAPEMMVNKSYDYKVDVWALGVILNFLFHRKSLVKVESDDTTAEQLLTLYSCIPDWEVPNYVNSRIRKRLTPDVLRTKPKRLSNGCQKMSSVHRMLFDNLMEGLLNMDPLLRLSASGALHHDIFSSRQRRLYAEYVDTSKRSRSGRSTGQEDQSKRKRKRIAQCKELVKADSCDDRRGKKKRRGSDIELSICGDGGGDELDPLGDRPSKVKSIKRIVDVSLLLRESASAAAAEAPSTSSRVPPTGTMVIANEVGEDSSSSTPPDPRVGDQCIGKLRDDTLLLVQCKERQWAFAIVFQYHNFKRKNNPKWLHHSTIFMCMDLIDKFIYSTHHCSRSPEINVHRIDNQDPDKGHRRESTSGISMRLLDGDAYVGEREGGGEEKNDSDLEASGESLRRSYMSLDQVLQMAVCCMYIAMKFHIGFTEFPSIEEFNISNITMDVEKWESLEVDIVVHCLECMMYSPTLLDIACDQGIDLTGEDISKLLMVMQYTSISCGMPKSALLEVYMEHLRMIPLSQFPEY